MCGWYLLILAWADLFVDEQHLYLRLYVKSLQSLSGSEDTAEELNDEERT